MKVIVHEKIVSVLLLLQFCLTTSFVVPSSFRPSTCRLGAYSTDAADASFFIENPNVAGSADWELDCYSRPVMVDGKKLWEVLLTDSNGSFRLCERLPSNKYVSDSIYVPLYPYTHLIPANIPILILPSFLPSIKELILVNFEG